MPTWYSIRNRLEAGEVRARNSFERFITSFITSYGCLDVWYRSVASDSSELECRIYYIQSDSAYVATNSWERDGERPEYWLQIKGTAAEIRASLISLLPRISQLHATKRHGEWIYGAIQPFQGQGSITIDVNGNTIITGRFGDIAVYDGGVELNWEDIAWEFEGCSVTATAPPGTTICSTPVSYVLPICNETDPAEPVGTCVRGTCKLGFTATYPETATECDGVEWIQEQDLSGQSNDFWFERYNCEDVDPITGTCVEGDCGAGFTATPDIEADDCSGIDWFEGLDLSGQSQEFWETYYGCEEPDPIGCCILGPTCDWDFVGMTTESDCLARHAGLDPGTPYSWNQFTKEASCNLQYLTKTNNCSPHPQTIIVSVEYTCTSGSVSGPVGIPSGFFVYYPGQGYTRPAVKPGDSYTAPDFVQDPNADPPCGGYSLTGYSPTSGTVRGSVSIDYTFNLQTVVDDEQAEYVLDTTVPVGWPGSNVIGAKMNFRSNFMTVPECGGGCAVNPDICQGANSYQYSGTLEKLNAVVSGSLTRFYTPSTNTTTYSGGVSTNIGGFSRSIALGSNTSNVFFPSASNSPSWWATQSQPTNIRSSYTDYCFGDVKLNDTLEWGISILPEDFEGSQTDAIAIESYKVLSTVTEIP